MSSIMLIFILLFLTLSDSQSVTRNYTNGPIILSPSVTFYYSVDQPSDLIKFGLFFNDTSTLSDPSRAWVGLGIGESTSGSMLGADILSAHFSDDETNCSIVDRYVPFVAYPLREGQGPFPFPDDCGEPDWYLINCARNPVMGQAILEVDRPLSVTDSKQDREISSGLNAFMYAYGTEFGYHGDKRESTQIKFYEDKQAVALSNELPDDIDGFVDLLATNYTIPSRDTTYACTTRRIPLPTGGKKRMIVAAEPLINKNNDPFVHHFTLFLCESEDYSRQTENTVPCDGEDPPHGPLGNSDARCSTFIFGYAKGVGRLVYPIDVGILLDDKRHFLVMETHFNNPTGKKGIVDNSGIRVYYTDKIRKHVGGSLLIGDSLVSRASKTVISDFRYQHTCPSACTERFKTPINLFASLLHMHTTGKEISTNQYSKNGTFIQNVNKVNFWSDSFQQMRVLNPSVVLNPGDQLQLSCVYDTSKRQETVFGIRTKDEMCMDFVFYWPVQFDNISNQEVNLCTFFDGSRISNDSAADNFTICADGSRLDEFFSNNSKFPQSENPAFNDTVGTATDFGTKPFSCEMEPNSTPSFETVLPSFEIEPNSKPSFETVLPSSEPSPSVSTGQIDSDSITITPTASASEEDSISESPPVGLESACFPASATIYLNDNSQKRMDQTIVNDKVYINSDKESSKLFMFTHSKKNTKYKFIQLTTNINISITLTSGHYIYANGKLTQARNVCIGDKLQTMKGAAKVIDIRMKWDVGLFNPQTLHGDIVVDGVVTSTFTEAVDCIIATALLTPLRWVYGTVGLDLSYLFA